MSSLSKPQRIMLIASVGLVALNVWLGLLATGNGRSLEGEVVPARSPQMVSGALIMYGLFLPGIGLGLGSLAALALRRTYPYRTRQITCSLISVLILELLALGLTVSKLLWWGSPLPEARAGLLSPP